MNKKIIIVSISILLLIIIGVMLKVFVFYDKYEMPDGAIIKVSKKPIEVYKENQNIFDLIVENNVNIITQDSKIDTEKIGDFTYTIEYTYNGSFKKYFYDINYSIIDNTDPIFISGPQKTKTFFVGENSEEDLIKKITYADDFDTKPNLKVDGNVKFDTVGKYDIKYVLTDQSGNETIKDAIVNIIERPKNSDKKEEKENEDEEEDNSILFEDHIKMHKTNSTMVGIDISKWQGEVDFEKIKNAGVEFVILRLGVMKDKDSELVMDKTFEENYKNAKAQNLKIGIYVYSEAGNVETAKSNAQFVIDSLKGDKLDFPVCFDWESWAYFNDFEINLHTLNKMYEAFSSTLKKAGYDTMLYGSENYLNNTFLTLKDYTIWVAKYSTKMPEVNGRDYILWQTANTGRVDGIKGDVDLDVYYPKRVK